MASSLSGLDKYHPDYSIVVTFITLLIPTLENISTLAGVAASLMLAVLLSDWQLGDAIVVAAQAPAAASIERSALLNPKAELNVTPPEE